MRLIENVNVAVLGGAGFIGSHLVDHLISDRNCNVLVLDNLIAGQKSFLNKKAKFEWCDITQSEERMRRLFVAHKIDYVFNYVAEPYIPVSFERPLHVFDTNARAALMAMNASQEAGVKGFLQVSSAEIYGKVDGQITEDAEARPHSTYGSSKLAIDALVQARWKEAKTPAIALRQFNVVGERETHPYVIPEIIKQLEPQTHPIGELKLGNNSTRDFQYVGDAVRMAVSLLEHGQFGEVYNMGSEETIKIYDLAHLIGKLMDFENIDIEQDESRIRPWEIWHLQSDNTKLYNTIPVRPEVSLEEALRRTINDYKINGFCWL